MLSQARKTYCVERKKVIWIGMGFWLNHGQVLPRQTSHVKYKKIYIADTLRNTHYALRPVFFLYHSPVIAAATHCSSVPKWAATPAKLRR